ncbi:MAG: hypothetical protein IIZ12_07055 [Eggerthellaceae bacterium]|nr:hypothetical protein [Eggerthellaceae bacterium]
MTKLNEKQIEKLEANGFNRWTKGSFDRLYINCANYGCEFEYYNTGNIRHAYFNGELVSNSEGRRFKGTKAFIDVTTGELHIDTATDYEREIREAVEAIIANALAEEAANDNTITIDGIGNVENTRAAGYEDARRVFKNGGVKALESYTANVPFCVYRDGIMMYFEDNEL